FFFSRRGRHTRFSRDWSSDVCSSDLAPGLPGGPPRRCVLRAAIRGSALRRGRGPLLVERGDALVAVGGEGGGAPGGVLDVEGGVEGDPEAGAQGVLGVAQPRGRVGGDLGRELRGDGAGL